MASVYEALRVLVCKNDSQKIFDEQLKDNVENVIDLLNLRDSDLIPELELYNDKSIRWKFISLSYHVLLSINDDECMISVSSLNDIKKIFQFIVSLGVLPNVMPGIGLALNKRCKNFDKVPLETLSVQEQYTRLTGTVKGMLLCLEKRVLRNYIVAKHLNELLSALFQICQAPLKRPAESSIDTPNEFVMTKSFYEQVLKDRQYFQLHLDKLLFETYSPQIFIELMFFYGNTKTPRWLKSYVYKILNVKLQQSDGVENLIKALIDSDSIDTGAKWKQCDILVKLLLTKPTNIDNDLYFKNICTQILYLLKKTGISRRKILDYERIVALCIKYLYETNENVCRKYLLHSVINTLAKYTCSSDNTICNEIVTDTLVQNISLLNYCFIETSVTIKNVPSCELRSIIAVLFVLFNSIRKSSYSEMADKIKNILIKYLNDCDEIQKFIAFQAILYGSNTNDISQLNNNNEFIVNKDNEIEVVLTTNVQLNPLARSECLLEIIHEKNAENPIVPLCKYLLDVSMNTCESSKSEILNLESDKDLDKTNRKLVAYHLMSNLLEKKNVQMHLKRNPKTILNFIERAIKFSTQNKVHQSHHSDSEPFQNLFLLIMITSIVTENVSNNILDEYENLNKSLKLIYNETPNEELKTLISGICNAEDLGKKTENETNEFEKAIEDVFDPLLPIRGHGLMTLARLIEDKNPEACARKQYILNICLQQIKHEDSYIYLNAIKVLAAIGDSFPDIVLNTLTDEYCNGSKELHGNDLDTRMKIGEVLLRVVKSLGKTAPKYKSLLLNTFMTGVRDDDHLIRASSLSNLGELCRVLGYKLGSVVTEVLSCIHGIIATDKVVEVRRAAVSVIRWLFVGLEKDTIVFLKDEILPLYRTLKEVYKNDPDDITRLQAQLALEELNENVRDFVFPHLELEKKNVKMLK